MNTLNENTESKPEKFLKIIVTGSGRGIGRAIALELGTRGHTVVLASRTEAQLRETADQIAKAEGSGEKAGRAIVVPTDVTDLAAVERLVDRTLSEAGGLDAVVNNAGSFNTIGPTWETDPESYWKDLTVNLRGPFLICRTVIPHMIAQGYGTIVNMIGGGAAGPIPYGNAYGTSKAGLTRFTETLAAELKEHKVSVFATNPGLVRTEMTELQLETDAGKRWMGRIAQLFDQGVDRPPTDAALLIRRLLEGDYFALTGRRFGPEDDPAEVITHADEILEKDLRTLRFNG